MRPASTPCWRAARLAKSKGLSVVSGLCLRYDNGFRETVKRLHDGAAGEITTLLANDYRSGRWAKPRQSAWTEMTYQMRNWYNFTWLSGDFNVEQHVHFLDVCAWIMKEQYPVKAVGMGGRQVLTGDEYGNIYDHFSVVYEYADGARLISNCRQQPGCKNDMSAHVLGTKGKAIFQERKNGLRIESAAGSWHYDGPQNNIYQTEHDEFFASIRERPADQQRRLHGQEHAAGDHGPDGRLHRPGDHLGDGPELQGVARPGPLRLEWRRRPSRGSPSRARRRLPDGRTEAWAEEDHAKAIGCPRRRQATRRIEPPLVAWPGGAGLCSGLARAADPGAGLAPAARSPRILVASRPGSRSPA